MLKLLGGALSAGKPKKDNLKDMSAARSGGNRTAAEVNQNEANGTTLQSVARMLKLLGRALRAGKPKEENLKEEELYHGEEASLMQRPDQ